LGEAAQMLYWLYWLYWFYFEIAEGCGANTGYHRFEAGKPHSTTFYR